MHYLPEDQVAEALDWKYLVDHHLYRVTPFQELSIDTPWSVARREIRHEIYHYHSR